MCVCVCVYVAISHTTHLFFSNYLDKYNKHFFLLCFRNLQSWRWLTCWQNYNKQNVKEFLQYIYLSYCKAQCISTSTFILIQLDTCFLLARRRRRCICCLLLLSLYYYTANFLELHHVQIKIKHGFYVISDAIYLCCLYLVMFHKPNKQTKK